MARMRALRPAAVAIVLAVLVTASGCKLPGDKGKSGGGESSGCANDGQTQQVLPRFPDPVYDDTYDMTINPCLEFLDIPATVLSFVPESEQKSIAKFDSYREKLTKVADRLAAIKDVIQCGYQADRVAIGVYQGATHKWSIAVTIVIRGDIDAFLHVTECYVGNLIRDYICPGCGGGEEHPQSEIRPCFDFTRIKKDGQTYTLLYAGSSNTLCAALDSWAHQGYNDSQYVLQATVTAKPTLIIRSGPGQSYDRLGAVDTGAVIYLDCYVEGELIQPSGDRAASNLWSRTTVNGVTGFVSNAYVDTSGDRPYAGYQQPVCA